MSTLNDLKNTSETPLLSNENKYPKINNSNIQNNNTPNNNKVQNINKNNNITPQNDNQYYSTLPTPITNQTIKINNINEEKSFSKY